jgi:hypothetical protein
MPLMPPPRIIVPNRHDRQEIAGSGRVLAAENHWKRLWPGDIQAG